MYFLLFMFLYFSTINYVISTPKLSCKNSTDDCSIDEFGCNFVFECIAKNKTCDGWPDCMDRSDETPELCSNSTCPKNTFTCAYGACVALSAVCDGKDDCIDRSDEKNCDFFIENVNKCNGKDTISCLTTNECISIYERCDGIADCADNSDETYTTCHRLKCSGFQCAYGACIDAEDICDGVPDCLDYSDELLPECLNKPNATAVKCADDQFTCRTNFCIDKKRVCDGIRDCDDGSDETYQQCSNETCDLNTQVRCAYGACVPGQNISCDYCVDESLCKKVILDVPVQCNSGHVVIEDNFPLPSRPAHLPPPPMLSACRFPVAPEHGNYTSPTGATVKPLGIANVWTIIQFTCDPEYILVGDQILVCTDDSWNKPIPTCKAKCPLLSSDKHTITCSLNNQEIPCTLACDGAIANIECKDTFQVKDTIYQPYNGIVCENGTWNKPLFNCETDCGIIGRAQPLVIHGFQPKKHEYPWHAGIYRRDGLQENGWEQICGGTLITEKIVISAAHCFWDWFAPKKSDVNVSMYAVAVGKYFREWGSAKDLTAQYRGVDRIVIHKKFNADESSYAFDIAIVVLNKTVSFSTVVLPACVDWSNRLTKKILQPGNKGTIAGWGLTEEEGNASEELQAVNMPYVTYEECINTSPVDFRRYITSDKICAGYTNGTSLCTGDSGGGLAFKRNSRFFVQGVVSVSPAKGNTCDSFKYVAFTSIPDYVPWIRETDNTISNER